MRIPSWIWIAYFLQVPQFNLRKVGKVGLKDRMQISSQNWIAYFLQVPQFKLWKVGKIGLGDRSDVNSVLELNIFEVAAAHKQSEHYIMTSTVPRDEKMTLEAHCHNWKSLCEWDKSSWKFAINNGKPVLQSTTSTYKVILGCRMHHVTEKEKKEGKS